MDFFKINELKWISREKNIGFYFGDILIYIKGLYEHINPLRRVLEILGKKWLYANIKKCDFYMETIMFLGYFVQAK